MTAKNFSVVALCSAETEELPEDFQLHSALKPLQDFKSVKNKNISNPYLFWGALLVTNFVRSAGSRTKGVWRLLEKPSRADIRLAEMEYPLIKKNALSFCSGKEPVYVHPSFYRALKLKYQLDVGGVSRDDRVTTELGTGSLRHAVGILTQEDFRAVVDSDSGKWVWWL